MAAPAGYSFYTRLGFKQMAQRAANRLRREGYQAKVLRGRKEVFFSGEKARSTWEVWKGPKKNMAKKRKPNHLFGRGGAVYDRKTGKFKGSIGRSNPAGWIKAKAVKVIRNKRGQAVKLRIRT